MKHWLRRGLGAPYPILAALFLLLGDLSASDAMATRTGSGGATLLNGTWKFRYEPQARSFGEPRFQGVDFDDSTWADITVPGHWELQGFAEPRYASVEPGVGYYRRTFALPEGSAGQRIILRFEGVLYGFRAWVNGRLVGEWDSSFNPAAFDITDAVNRDHGPQVLAVEVSTRTKSWEFDTMDCWALSGIFRDVTLQTVPELHLRDFGWTTTVAVDGSAHVRLQVETSGPGRVAGRLLAPGGDLLRSFELATDTSGAGRIEFDLPAPQLWTAETPALHLLQLTVGDGATAHATEARVGIRQVAVAGGVLRLNGRPIKLRGINHHDMYPQGGRVATEQEMRQDLALMRAANINFIRTSHYPPHPRLIELCDEMGFYVMCEVPFTFGERHLRDPSYAPALQRRARATVSRDRNQPSIIVWSIGNEHPITALGLETARLVKDLDPSRPVCFPTVGPEFERDLAQYLALPDFIEIFAPHYPTNRQIELYLEKLNRPVIFTEFAHAMGLATDRLEEQWETMRRHPGIAGGALWLFQDQGIRRRAERAVDVAKPTPHAWPDAHHYFDTAGSAGADGIVYSDRTPQLDYYQVQRVYAPVRLDVEFGPDHGGNLLASVKVENRHDFRTLAGFRLDWSLAANGKPIQSGVTALPADTQTLELARPWTADTPEIHTLTLRCLAPDGRVVTERSFRVPTAKPQALQPLVEAELPTAELQVEETNSRVSVIHPRIVLEVNKQTGAVEIRNRAGVVLGRGLQPHTGRKLTMAEEERTSKQAIWRGSDLETQTGPALEVGRVGGAVQLKIHARYLSPSAPGAALAGTTTLTVSRQGLVTVDYDFAVTGGSGQVLEAGLSLWCPAPSPTFRWIGHGPFAGYPGKDALNDFGIFALPVEDLNFQGNRRAVELALLTDDLGRGLALFCPPSDVAVERSGSAVLLRHNVHVSGRGNTDIGPETVVDGASLRRLAGSFALLPLDSPWPGRLQAWFSRCLERPPAFRPFLHSYDQ